MPRLYRVLIASLLSCPAAALAGPGAAGEEAGRPATRPAAATTAPAARMITLDEFDRRRGEKGNVVLDVRTPEEFAGGHVPGAVNVPVQSPDFDEKVSALDKDRTYLVHCARGGRSAQAVARMGRMGFGNLADFSGGMEAWKKSGKPTTRSDEK